MALVAQYNGPFKGLNTDNPSILIDKSEAAVCNNFMLRQNYIGTRPSFGNSAVTAKPTTLPITGIGQANYFIGDSSASQLIVADTNNAYYYSGLLWNKINSTPFSAASLYAWDWLNALQSFIFVNESRGVYQWVPSTGIFSELTGGLYGSRYIMELAQTLLIGFTTETGGFYPQRIRWCNAGNITQWDPSAYLGAGFSDLLDCSDFITGMFAVGSTGYVLRVNGITQITPTGNGIQPWYFNHLWASEMGIGLIFPQTQAQYGSYVFIVAYDNVYLFTPASINAIANNVIDSIVSDINAVTSYQLSAQHVYACVTPIIQGGYSYFVYKLYILKFITSTSYSAVVWTYDIKSNNWVRETLTTNAVIGGQPAFVVDSSNVTQQLYVPVGNNLYVYNTTNFSCEQPCAYHFRYEQQQELKYESVSWVGIRYKNIGLGTLTVTINSPSYAPGTNSMTLTLGDNTKNKLYYNGGVPPLANADNRSYVAFFSFHPVTDESFQIQLSCSANAGPIQIEQVSVYSEQQEEAR